VISFEDVWKVTREIGDHRLLEYDEAVGLYACCAQVPEGGTVVEVGCDAGRSSSLIAQVGKSVKYRSIHIDPFTEHPDNRDAWCKLMHSLGSRYSLILLRTKFASLHLSGIAVDLAYIDGDHEESAVTTDLNLIASKVRQGGYLACHDYATMDGVKQAVDPYVKCGWSETRVFGSLGVWRKK
jgi:hypothetical protein